MGSSRIIKAMKLRILNGEEVRAALPMEDAIEAMRTAFEILSQNQAIMPERSLIKIQAKNATSLIMPVYAEHFGHISIKVINAFNRNPGEGIERVHGLLILFDGQTGKPVAMCEGRALTAARTGAASGLATDLMARKHAETAAIIGAGVQGMTQLEAISRVRPIKNAYVYDLDHTAAERFARQMRQRLAMDITAADSSEEAVHTADVICTATVSRTPVFKDHDIAHGTHINAIGSFKPDHQEIPEKTVLRSRLVVDHRQSVLSETGDLIIPMGKGILKANHIQAELGDLVLGHASGRENDHQVTLFKSVGSAIQDLAAATAALKNAEAKNIGLIVDI